MKNEDDDAYIGLLDDNIWNLMYLLVRFKLQFRWVYKPDRTAFIYRRIGRNDR
jgi:hypothetical protein